MPTFFPYWVVVLHFLNIFLTFLLFRSGLEVLSAFPKLYWHDDCPPGREWLRVSKKMYGADSRRPWTSLDEATTAPGHQAPLHPGADGGRRVGGSPRWRG